MISSPFDPCPAFRFGTHRPPHFELEGSETRPAARGNGAADWVRRRARCCRQSHRMPETRRRAVPAGSRLRRNLNLRRTLTASV
jgi:hypothetical protein